MNREQLTLAIDLFESKVIELEDDYKKNHKEDFEIEKMKRYINKKLKNDIRILAFYNMMPSVKIIQNSESFKY